VVRANLLSDLGDWNTHLLGGAGTGRQERMAQSLFEAKFSARLIMYASAMKWIGYTLTSKVDSPNSHRSPESAKTRDQYELSLLLGSSTTRTG